MPFIWGKKQNFKQDNPVVIYNLGEDDIEYTGIIKGKSFFHLMDSYIVELSPESMERIYGNAGHMSKLMIHDPDGDKWSCVSITEACLKRPGE